MDEKDDNVRELRPTSKEQQATRSAEHMAAMRARRRELIAGGDRNALGGRRRIRLNAEEIEERANQQTADALAGARVKALNELEKLLASKDSADRKFAVKTILEYTDGKPKQVLETPDGGPVTIVYQTAALPPAFTPQALEDAADSR